MSTGEAWCTGGVQLLWVGAVGARVIFCSSVEFYKQLAQSLKYAKELSTRLGEPPARELAGELVRLCVCGGGS